MLGSWILRGARRLALAVTVWLAAGTGLAHAQIRQTESGPVQGITGFGISQFRGIPYAAPPVGDLRWRPPAPPLAWVGTRDASKYGPACPQSPSLDPVDEDCLSLNVFVPATTTRTAKLPVMVWIHGGGFITGSGRDFDGTFLALRENVIVVTINYRLGYLGFLAHAALSARDPHRVSGNYGIMDQQAALAWVRRNIANFGGNPSLITIFGESAGGQSVVDQLISPTAGPLAAAIIQSGAYATSFPTVAQSESTGADTATKLGCPDQSAACLQGLSADTLAKALNGLTSLGGVSPVIDGITLPLGPAQAFAKGKFQHIPVINGSNHDEYRLFIGLFQYLLHTPAMTADQYAEKVKGQFGPLGPKVLSLYPLKKYGKPDYAYAAVLTDVAFACGTNLLNGLMARHTQVYQYELADPDAPTATAPPIAGFSYGSSHSADLSDLFPSYQVPLGRDGPPVFDDDQQALRLKIQDFWGRMARFGNPNGLGGQPAWPRFSSAAPVIVQFTPPAATQTQSFAAAHHCAFWNPILRRQAGL